MKADAAAPTRMFCINGDCFFCLIKRSYIQGAICYAGSARLTLRDNSDCPICALG